MISKSKKVLLCGNNGKIRESIFEILQEETQVDSITSIEPTGLKEGGDADLLIVLLVDSKTTDSLFEELRNFRCPKLAVHTFDREIVRDNYLAKGFDEYVSIFDLLEDLSPIIAGLLHDENKPSNAN